MNDLALVTDLLYRCSYLHRPSFQLSAISLQQNFICSDTRCGRDLSRTGKVPPLPCRRAECKSSSSAFSPTHAPAPYPCFPVSPLTARSAEAQLLLPSLQSLLFCSWNP